MPTVRYSQLYERGETLARDSVRMRNRLERLVYDYFEGARSIELGRLVERECGIDIVVTHFNAYSDWRSLFRNGQLRDVFDTILFAYNSMNEYEDRHQQFLNLAIRIMDEECVGYFIDENAVVHPKFDDAFEVVRQSVILGLSGEGFAAAREHLAAVDRALLQTPIDGRTAIRRTFDITENIFKQNFLKVTHVNQRELRANLRPVVKVKHASDAQECHVALKLYDGLCNWVNAVHFYRHEAGRPEPTQPSEATTIAIVSQGYSHARWLLETLQD